MNWERYLNIFIKHYREKFEKLDDELRSLMLQSYPARVFSSPCQVEVIETTEPRLFLWIVTVDKKRPDMDFVINRDIDDIVSFAKGRVRKILSTADRKFLIRYLTDFLSKGWINFHLYPSAQCFTMMFRYLNWKKEGNEDPIVFAMHELELYEDYASEILRRKEIERTTTNIRRDAEEIPQTHLRTKIIEATDKLNKQIEELYEYVEKEIGGVRKIMGVSREYQDWRVLASDVHRLKQEHVSKEVFESEVGRLSAKIEGFEKIERAYERLSSQQERVLEQQSSFLKWIKYSTILVPIAVACIPIVEILIRHFLGIL